MSFWYNLLTGVGIVYLFNNYVILNINYSSGYNLINNRISWNIFKFYAISKRKALLYVQDMKKRFYQNSLHKNVVFLKNGEREKIVDITGDSYDAKLPQNVDNFDMILYRIPSTESNDNYNLLRLDLDTDSLKDLEQRECVCYKGKLHSPIVSFDNCDDSYDLDINYDNYYVVGNILFDKPFINWLMREKYNICLPSNNYTITYFDEDMSENSLSENECLLVDEDLGIRKIDCITENNTNDSEKLDATETSSSGWFW